MSGRARKFLAITGGMANSLKGLTSARMTNTSCLTAGGNTTDQLIEVLNHTNPYEDLPFLYFSISVLCLEATTGAFLNILTITSILKFRKLQIPSNMLILSLSLSDCIPLPVRFITVMLEMYRSNRNTWNILCTVQISSIILAQAINVTTISLIAVERAISIIFPIWARNNITNESAKMSCLILWGITTPIFLATALYANNLSNIRTQKCEWHVYLTDNALTFLIVAFTCFSLLTLIMYMAILWKLRAMKREVSSFGITDGKQQSQLKICRMMGTGIHFQI